MIITATIFRWNHLKIEASIRYTYKTLLLGMVRFSDPLANCFFWCRMQARKRERISWLAIAYMWSCTCKCMQTFSGIDIKRSFWHCLLKRSRTHFRARIHFYRHVAVDACSKEIKAFMPKMIECYSDCYSRRLSAVASINEFHVQNAGKISPSANWNGNISKAFFSIQRSCYNFFSNEKRWNMYVMEFRMRIRALRLRRMIMCLHASCTSALFYH